MTQATVKLQSPFESLVDAITSLGLEEKRKLRKLLDEEITQAIEDQSSHHDSQNELNIISQTDRSQDGKNIFFDTLRSKEAQIL